MKCIIFKLIILNNINYVRIIIIRPKNQNGYPKLNVPYFWNNYTICTIILNTKMLQRGHRSVFSPWYWFKTH